MSGRVAPSAPSGHLPHGAGEESSASMGVVVGASAGAGDVADVLAGLDPARRLYVEERARGGAVTAAARVAGVSRSTGTRWEALPEVRAALDAAMRARYTDPIVWLDDLVPDAVAKLKAAVANGEAWAVRDVLDRRYGKAVQRQEVTGAGGGPVEVALSREALMARVLLLAAEADAAEAEAAGADAWGLGASGAETWGADAVWRDAGER